MFWSEYPRDVIEVRGPGAAVFLDSQVSNDLRPLAIGDSRWTFLLEPTGKVVALMRVWRREDDAFVLDTDAGFGEVAEARLRRFKIRVAAEIEPRPWRCIAVRGEHLPDAPDGLTSWGDGFDLLGPTVEPPLGVPEGDAGALGAARIEAAWPQMGTEIVPGHTIPAETGVIDVAVSFTKGCYPGQELVERMDSRGASAPRRLMLVDVPAGTAAGDDCVIAGQAVGTVTSVAGTRALALVTRRGGGAGR